MVATCNVNKLKRMRLQKKLDNEYVILYNVFIHQIVCHI